MDAKLASLVIAFLKSAKRNSKGSERLRDMI